MIIRPIPNRISLFLLATVSTLCLFVSSKYLDGYEMRLSTWVKNITASSTCGYGPDPEEFCLWTRSGRAGLHCTKCDSRVGDLAHSITLALEDSNRWWKSENGLPKVTIDVDLGQEFFVTGIILKMGPTPKPAQWVLERSGDFGKTYTPWQYFESSERNCTNNHNIAYNAAVTKSDQILCRATKTSDIEYEEVVVQLLENRPGWKQFNGNELLQNWTKATNIRFRFLYWGTHFGDQMYNDESVAKTRFYTLQAISIFGRCVCYGHDRGCEQDSKTGRLVCKCQHNTCGPQCNVCCPGFNQHQWQPSRQCHACNCFGHSDDCYYNRTVERLKLSRNVDGSYSGGGVCINCKHHTAGPNCDTCVDGFFRPALKQPTDLDACEACKCDKEGSISNVCSQVGGQCRCRDTIGGRACNICIPGHYAFPKCKPCNCSKAGAFNIGTCNEKSGQCLCKKGMVGRFCDQCPSEDRHLKTPDGCLECDTCSLVQYRTLDTLFRTANHSTLSMLPAWPAKSWVDVRLLFHKGYIQHLKNFWNEVYEGDFTTNQMSLAKAPLISELQTSFRKLDRSLKILARNTSSVLYRRDAIKLVDGILASKTSNLRQNIQHSNMSSQGAVGKLRRLATSQLYFPAVENSITEAESLQTSIKARDFGLTTGQWFHELNLTRDLHGKAVILKGHFHQFERLRRRLDRLITRIADISKRLWDPNFHLRSIKNSSGSTSARLRDVKQKLDAISQIQERMKVLGKLPKQLDHFRKKFAQEVELNYLIMYGLAEHIPKLKDSLSKYQDSLQSCQKYKPAFQTRLQEIHGNSTEIKSVYKQAIEKPQRILSNIADKVKMMYASENVAKTLKHTQNQIADIVGQYRNKFAEWFPVPMPETTTTTAAPLEFGHVTDMTDGDSSGLFFKDDDDDDDQWDNILMADEVFLENDSSFKLSSSKSSEVKINNDQANDLFTSMRTTLQDYQDKVKEAEDSLSHSGDILESALITLKEYLQKRTSSSAQQLIKDNKHIVAKISKLNGDMLTHDLKQKFGKVDLTLRRNEKSIRDNVKMANSALEKISILTKPTAVPKPMKHDAFTKLANSLKEKIAVTKSKASKIRAPLSLTSPGYVKLTLPPALAPSHSYITSINVWFYSAYGDAFIFRIGDSSTTWGTGIFLGLSNYHLEMHIHQNRRVWNGTLPTYIERNRWYRVEIEWLCSQVKVTLTAARGKTHLNITHLPWTCDMERIFVKFVWIGGLDEETETRVLSLSGRAFSDMDGCVGELGINDGSLNLFDWEASRGIQASCSSSKKDKHHRVSAMSIKGDVMQVHSSQSEIFPPLVEFSFRSTQRNATIVHITDAKQEEWMNVRLSDGQILVEFGHGQNTKLSLPSQLAYNNGQLHHVNVNFTGKEILKQVLVSVDVLDRHSGSLFVVQTKPSLMFIGGVPKRVHKPEAASLLAGSPAFVGCLVGMRINNKTMAISNHSEYLEFSLESCPVRMGKCTCLSGISGVIRVVRLGYIIDFLGLTFQINNLDSSTQGTILYYTPAPKTYLELFVANHAVWAAWKVGSKFNRVRLTDVYNGEWHTLLLQNHRNESSSVLQLDEATVELPLSLFLGIKYTAQHIVFLGGKALGKTEFQNICYTNFLLNDEVKDFSDLAISNGLSNCPSRSI